MDILAMLGYALGFSADAFAVSTCKGLAMKKATVKEEIIVGLWFGGFQALMPLAGYFLGNIFADAIQHVAPIVALALLILIGTNMIKEALSKCDCEDNQDGNISFKPMLIMAIATSIDAMAGGLSIALDIEGNLNIYITAALIGVVTFVLSAVGVKIGNVFGSRYEKKAQIVGGSILILLGIKILAEMLLKQMGVLG